MIDMALALFDKVLHMSIDRPDVCPNALNELPCEARRKQIRFSCCQYIRHGSERYPARLRTHKPAQAPPKSKPEACSSTVVVVVKPNQVCVSGRSHQCIMKELHRTSNASVVLKHCHKALLRFGDLPPDVEVAESTPDNSAELPVVHVLKVPRSDPRSHFVVQSDM